VIKVSKRIEKISKFVDKKRKYNITEAINIIKNTAIAKFDETIELHVKLGINVKDGDQIIRGTIILPYGTGRIKKIAVLAFGEKQKEAELAGADVVGYSDLINDISNSKLNFDILIATPDTIKDLKNVAKILGPRNLMPNFKSDTITSDIFNSVSEFKKGKIEYKSDSFGIIHIPVGKASFECDKIISNIKFFLKTIENKKPPKLNDQYIKNIAISSSMGVGVFIENKKHTI
jgi:large subunit ribosomal protein L1